MTRKAVVDASVALAWVLPGEDTARALPLREQAVDYPGFSLYVPQLFWYEVANVLAVAVRQGRLSRASALDALAAFEAFAFETWQSGTRECLELALETGLSVYDAAYLSLALGSGTPLWTLDRALREAAELKGVPLAP